MFYDCFWDSIFEKGERLEEGIEGEGGNVFVVETATVDEREREKEGKVEKGFKNSTLEMHNLGVSKHTTTLCDTKTCFYLFDSSLRRWMDFSVAKHFELIHEFNSKMRLELGRKTTEFKKLVRCLSEIPVVPFAPVSFFSPSSLSDCWELVTCLVQVKDLLSRVKTTRYFFERQFLHHIEFVAVSASDQNHSFGTYIQTHYNFDVNSQNEETQRIIWWIVTFLFFRSGNLAKFEECLRSRHSCAHLLSAFLNCKGGHLSILKKEKGALKAEYFSGRAIPWRTTIYLLLGLSLNEEDIRPALLSIEDFVWFRLVIIESSSHKSLQSLLLKLATELLSVRASNFHDPVVYCIALLGTQQYDDAVRFLYNCHFDLEIPAIHIGVVLYLCSRLETKKSTGEVKRDCSFIQSTVFFELILQYIRRFPPSHSNIALEYILLFAHSSFDFFCEGVASLVLDSRQFERLLGPSDLNFSTFPHFQNRAHDDHSIDGLVFNRIRGMKMLSETQSTSLSLSQEKKRIFKVIAKEAGKRGLLLDSVFFYFMANKWKNGFHLLATLVGNGLQGKWEENGGKRGGEEIKERILGIAFEVSELAKEIPERRDSEEVQNMELLLKLVDFFGLCVRKYGGEDYLRVIDSAYATGLLPLQGGQELYEKTVQFNKCSKDVQKLFGRIILSTMRALHHESGSSENGSRVRYGSEEIQAEWKRREELLVSFYNMIQNQFSSEINSEITRLCVGMGHAAELSSQ